MSMTLNEWLLQEQVNALQKQVTKGGAESLFWQGFAAAMKHVQEWSPAKNVPPFPPNRVESEAVDPTKKLKATLQRMAQDIRYHPGYAPHVPMMGTREEKDRYWVMKAELKLLEKLLSEL